MKYFIYMSHFEKNQNGLEIAITELQNYGYKI